MPQSMYFKRLSEQNKYIPVQIRYKKIKKKKNRKKKKETRKRGRRYIVQFFTVAAKRTIEILTKRSFILT